MISPLCYQLGDYKAGDVAMLDFCFDKYAFLIKEGDCLQMDISSTDICHTNKKGEYYWQAETEKVENKIHLDTSCLSFLLTKPSAKDNLGETYEANDNAKEKK